MPYISEHCEKSEMCEICLGPGPVDKCSTCSFKACEDCIGKWLEKVGDQCPQCKLIFYGYVRNLKLGENETVVPSGLHNLVKLDCSSTIVTEIPKDLVNLKILYCSSSRVTELPKELVNLEIINCDFTLITKIPKEYTKLKYISCEYSDIDEIPKEFVNLVTLKCYCSKIEQVPKELINLKVFNN